MNFFISLRGFTFFLPFFDILFSMLFFTPWSMIVKTKNAIKNLKSGSERNAFHKFLASSSSSLESHNKSSILIIKARRDAPHRQRRQEKKIDLDEASSRFRLCCWFDSATTTILLDLMRTRNYMWFIGMSEWGWEKKKLFNHVKVEFFFLTSQK